MWESLYQLLLLVIYNCNIYIYTRFLLRTPLLRKCVVLICRTYKPPPAPSYADRHCTPVAGVRQTRTEIERIRRTGDYSSGGTSKDAAGRVCGRVAGAGGYLNCRTTLTLLIERGLMLKHWSELDLLRGRANPSRQGGRATFTEQYFHSLFCHWIGNVSGTKYPTNLKKEKIFVIQIFFRTCNNLYYSLFTAVSSIGNTKDQNGLWKNNI